MNYGKYVFCEKLFVLNIKEMEEMILVVKVNGVVFMEVMKIIFLLNFKELKNYLYKIGIVCRFIVSYCQYFLWYDVFRNGIVLNVFQFEFFNGLLMDIGVYCIYFVVVLFGELQDVKVNGYVLFFGVDGEGIVILFYDGFEVVLMYFKILIFYVLVEIQGEDGMIVIDMIYWLE